MKTRLSTTLILLFTFICIQHSNASIVRASEFGWDAADATKAFQAAIN